ncbi:MAG: sulfatase-like hydrolase/transferase [Gaiellaceae bacterium]
MLRRGNDSQRSTLRTLGVAFAHLAALSAFAVAQPLFDLLGESPDFFAVRGSSRWDIVLFALAVVLVPPAALVAVEALAGLVSEQLRQALHLLFVGGLAGVVVVQALERTTDLSSTRVLLALAALLGAGVALLYWRARPFRTLLSVLAAAPLAFLLYFLFGSPVSDLTLADDPDVALANVQARAPVVLVVLDEFPVSSLLDGDGEVDAERYPHFAELAEGSTWFRHASTVSYSTTQAVSAILTGVRPEEAKPPVFASHPRNLFTLLGGEYRPNVFETNTRLCPDVVCGDSAGGVPGEEPASLYSDAGIVYLHLLAPPRLEEGLPPITGRWMNFGREEERADDLLAEALKEPPRKRRRAGERFHDVQTRTYARFLDAIEPGGGPSLNFAHVLLPHEPWSYFPSGSQSSLGPTRAPGHDSRADRWEGRFVTLQAYQRHLLQVGYVDRLLGDLLERLRETGMYDRSLVVVTADHGMSFREGESGRIASQANLEDVAFVPLFVKQPRQERGEVVDHHVETIDVLPTIAEVLGFRIPWRVDGRNALEDPGRGTIRVRTRPEPDGEASAPLAELALAQEEAVERKVALFGEGAWGSLFAAVPHRVLLGRRADELAAGSADDRASIDHELTRELLAQVEPGLPFVPSPLQGHVEGDGARTGRTLAVAVNGTIAALATIYRASGEQRFSALAPESAFRTGRNTVEFFWVDGGAGAEELTRLEPG